MRSALKIAHFIALAVFVGSIPAHIILAGAVDPALDPVAFAALQQGKLATIQALTLPGLAATGLTGVALAVVSQGYRLNWVRTKVVLTVAIALNGALILTPTGQEIAALAAEAVARGMVSPTLAGLEARESLFGAVNLLLIGLAFALAVIRPALVLRKG